MRMLLAAVPVCFSICYADSIPQEGNMRDGKDDGSFREIDDEEFDDSGNIYFPFRSERVHESEAENDGMEAMAEVVTEVVDDIVFRLISILPPEMQGDMIEAYEAIMEPSDGNAEDACRVFRRMWKNYRGPGAKLLEARSLRSLAVKAMQEGEDASAIIAKERKALAEYIKASDSDPAFDYPEYMQARLDMARSGIMTGDPKGAFNAFIELPDGSDFSMERLVSIMGEYFSETEGEPWEENSFTFETAAGNVVGITYTDIGEIPGEFGHEKVRELAALMEELGSSGMTLSVLVSAEDDATLAAYEFSLAIAACLECFPQVSGAMINDAEVGAESLRLLSMCAERKYFCSPVLYGFSEGKLESGERVYMTCSASRWGREDLAVIIPSSEEIQDADGILSEAMGIHVKKKLKEGAVAVLTSGSFSVRKGSADGRQLLVLEKEA